MAKKVNFEESINRLKEIVSVLENGEVNLEESVKLFEEGAKISATCYEILNNAELKVKEITNSINGEESSDND